MEQLFWEEDLRENSVSLSSLGQILPDWTDKSSLMRIPPIRGLSFRKQSKHHSSENSLILPVIFDKYSQWDLNSFKYVTNVL